MQAVRNIFWWLCFVALGICVQSLVPCLDALVVGLVILLQERDYKNLCWLLPLFVLLQEGIGTSPFGATIVWYALVCLIYRLLRWLLGLGNFFLVLLLEPSGINRPLRPSAPAPDFVGPPRPPKRER